MNLFLSTPSARRATPIKINPWSTIIFLSTPSARRATRGAGAARHRPCHFYPRPPRGGRHKPAHNIRRHSEFLSTPSARRATYDNSKSGISAAFLSTPSARRATSLTLSYKIIPKQFLSTPSARRATICSLGYDQLAQIFLSTPSARRATKNREPERDRLEISIHALREEGDTKAVFVKSAKLNFYPRPPRGGRPQ